MLIVYTNPVMRIYIRVNIGFERLVFLLYKCSTLAIKLNSYCLAVGASTLSKAQRGFKNGSLKTHSLKLVK